jgi:hypothetical protein
MQITKTIVYSQQGEVINFGAWDYQHEEIWVDEDNPQLGKYTIARNPLPEGAVAKDVAITIPELTE